MKWEVVVEKDRGNLEVKRRVRVAHLRAAIANDYYRMYGWGWSLGDVEDSVLLCLYVIEGKCQDLQGRTLE